MELIGLLLMSFIAYATAVEKYEIHVTHAELHPKYFNRWINVEYDPRPQEPDSQIKMRETIVEIVGEITEEDALLVQYAIQDSNEKPLASGIGPLCGDRDSEVGAIMQLLEKIVNIDLKCPISKERSVPKKEITAEIFLEENPGEEEIFGIIQVEKQSTKSTAIYMIVYFYGQVTKS